MIQYEGFLDMQQDLSIDYIIISWTVIPNYPDLDFLQCKISFRFFSLGGNLFSILYI